MKTIHHIADIEAKPAAVFAALTTQAGLASWWSTKVSAPAASEGSVVRFTFFGDFNPVMKITRLVTDKELEWKCVDGHDKWADNTFRFTLEPMEDGRTRVRFWQHYAVELADDYYGVYNFNWGYYVESLNEYCSKGKGTPFSPPA